MSRQIDGIPRPIDMKIVDPPTNTFEIDPNNGKAVRLLKSEFVKRFPTRASETSRYFIARGSHLSNTSQTTVDKINGNWVSAPTEKEALANAIVQYMQAELTAGNSFDYKSLSIQAFEIGMAQYPDDKPKAVRLIGELLGEKLGDSPEAAPVYHIYESIVGNYDKVQHFVRSAKSEYFGTSLGTDILQYGKEVKDLGKWLTGGGGTGFDWDDMKANNEGQAYGAKLKAEHQQD